MSVYKSKTAIGRADDDCPKRSRYIDEVLRRTRARRLTHTVAGANEQAPNPAADTEPCRPQERPR